jgi:hypothetical protein
MALAIDAERSPRLIWVDAATNEVTVQELVDQLRDWEDGLVGGMTYPRIISAAGKEDLGGGIKVGITATLQNAQIAFTPATTTTSSGSVTTGSASGELLIDSAGSFQTDGVAEGANVINATTGAFGTVLSIDSETQLTLRTLNGGTRQDWQIGDDYHVHNVVRKVISGGNLVAVDTAQVELESIYPTAFTQVVRTSASNATLQESIDIQFTSFDNASVWVDPNTSYSGTAYPVGTTRQPVNNSGDAQLIADERGLFNLTFRGNTTVASTHSNMKFWGRSPRTTQITIDSGATLSGCEFELCLLSGDLGTNGSSYFITVALKDVTGIFGHLEGCILREGTNTVNTFVMLNKCAAVSAVNPGTDIPILDLNGNGRMAARSLDGEIIIQNKSSGNDCSLHLEGAVVTLTSTITAGTWRFHGVGTVIDNSGGTAVIDTTDLVSPQSVATEVWVEPIESTYTAEEVMKIMASALAGKVSGAGTGTETFKGLDGSTDRIVSTVDVEGNRSAVSVDGT